MFIHSIWSADVRSLSFNCSSNATKYVVHPKSSEKLQRSLGGSCCEPFQVFRNKLSAHSP